MRNLTIFILSALLVFPALAQEEDGEKKGKKRLNLRERIGKVAGNLLTSKTDQLDGVIVKVNYVNGIYSSDIETTESKYFDESAREGDHMVGVSFFKESGVGLVEVKGELSIDGEPMEYIGLGSFGKHYFAKPDKPLALSIKTEAGDEASFTLKQIPGVEIISVNGETALPILDLDSDIELEYFNPPNSIGTTIRISMLTKVLGVTTLNHFADFKVKEEGNVKVTIPKEALANPEYAGELNIGNFSKGENYLIVEREVKTSKEDFGADQSPGDLFGSELFTRNYASFPIIVKGKQDEGLISSIKIQGRSEDRTLGYDFHKPNAQTGIPFSRASKFGLASLTIQANTYREEEERSSHSYTVGNTIYTQTTITTTTFEFPQLEDAYWDNALEYIYGEVTRFFKDELNIEFVPVENVTGTADYGNLFQMDNEITKEEASKSYKNTLRYTPQSIGEVLSQLNRNYTTDNPTVNIMKQAGDIDGLVAISIRLAIGANRDKNIVLIPTMDIMIHGRDEERDDKQGKYFEGVVRRTTGEVFNEAMLRSNPDELIRVCSIPMMLEVMKSAIATIKVKEEQLGFDKIWSIGEN